MGEDTESKAKKYFAGRNKFLFFLGIYLTANAVPRLVTGNEYGIMFLIGALLTWAFHYQTG